MRSSVPQSSGSVLGEIISPMYKIDPAMSPRRLLGYFGADNGTISATGFPYLVTRIGLRVLRTRSITDRQVILNLDAAISSITKLYHHSWYKFKPRYQPTGLPLFCSSSHAFSGAK